jgi:GNAT superfamily N-acetyltransferase
MYSGSDFIGCVSIDRKQFYPYIGNLYVVPHKRKNGYASVLLRLAEDYTGLLSFTDSRLWCEKHLVKYYQKRGYKIEEQKSDIYYMIKSIKS